MQIAFHGVYGLGVPVASSGLCGLTGSEYSGRQHTPKWLLKNSTWQGYMEEGSCGPYPMVLNGPTGTPSLL